MFIAPLFLLPGTSGVACQFLIAAFTLAALVASGMGPTDRLTWFMEVVWVIAALPLLLLATLSGTALRAWSRRLASGAGWGKPVLGAVLVVCHVVGHRKMPIRPIIGPSRV